MSEQNKGQINNLAKSVYYANNISMYTLCTSFLVMFYLFVKGSNNICINIFLLIRKTQRLYLYAQFHVHVSWGDGFRRVNRVDAIFKARNFCEIKS